MIVIDSREKLEKLLYKNRYVEDCGNNCRISVCMNFTIIIKDLVLDDVTYFSLLGNSNKFNEIIFYNCIIKKTDNEGGNLFEVYLHSNYVVRFINCVISGIDIKITGNRHTKGMWPKILFYGSTSDSTVNLSYFMDTMFLNSNINRIRIDEGSFDPSIGSGEEKLSIVNSSVKNLYFESRKNFFNNIITDNSLYFSNINIEMVRLNQHSYHLKSLKNSSSTLKSLMDPGIIELQLGCGIKNSDFSNLDLSHCKFNIDARGFFRCDVSNMNMKNIKTDINKMFHKDAFCLWIDECKGVDTIFYDEKQFIIEVENSRATLLYRDF